MKSRLRGAVLPAIGLLGLAGVAIQPGSGDIVKPSWKAKGGSFSDAEKMAVRTAIDKFGALTITIPSLTESGTIESLRATTIDLKKCADCLKMMLDKGRLCKETDPNHDFGAVTAADDSDKCQPASDGMNVSTTKLDFNVPEKLAAALAHEWCHTAQANATGAANFEIPCYEVEIEVLKALKAGAAAANQVRIQNRIDQMTKCVNDLKAKLAGAVIPPKTIADGGQIFESASGRTYGAFSGEGPFLFLGDATTPLFSQPLVGMTRPFNLEVVENFFGPGDDLVFVAGIDEPSDTGMINVMLANPSFGASPVHLLPATGVHPFDTEFDETNSTLYVLDTANSQIVSVQFDPTNFFNPPSAGPLFADDVSVATLSTANAIELLEPASPTSGGSGATIAAFEDDLRGVDRVGSFQLSNQKIMTDTDNDGAADNVVNQTFLDDFHVLPGYPDRIQDGDTFMRVIGSAGAAIGIDVVDPSTGETLETIGSTLIPPDTRIGHAELFRPLVQGEAILARDFTNNFDILPAPESVRPFCFDFDGDGRVGPTDLLLLLAGFGSEFGPDELLGLLAAFGQACP